MDINTYSLELVFILMNFYQQQKLIKRDILTETLLLRKKDKKHQKLGCKFIRINTSNAKNTYDLDYEVSDIEAFIDEFNKKKIKQLEDKIKEKEEESNEKIKLLEDKIKEQKSRFAKELLSYVSSISTSAKHIKYFVKKILPTL